MRLLKKRSLKIIDLDVEKLRQTIKTPQSTRHALLERNINLSTPRSFTKSQSNEKNIIQINLQPSFISPPSFQMKTKITLKRKSSAIDFQQQTMLSQKKQKINQSQPKSMYGSIIDKKCFEDCQNRTNSAQIQNWQHLIHQRKQKMYSQFYRIDKLMTNFERDIFSFHSQIDQMCKKSQPSKQSVIFQKNKKNNVQKMNRRR